MIINILLLITTFNKFVLNVIIIIFSIIATSFFDSDKLYLKLIKGLLMGLFAAFLMLNPIRLPNGVYFDGKTVLFTILGLFSGVIPTITALAVAIPLRFAIEEVGNYWVSILTMLNSGLLSMLVSLCINKLNHNKEKKICYVLNIFLINLLNIFIFLRFNTTNTTFMDLFLPMLIVFPILTILTTYFYMYNVNYNQIIKDNIFHKKILTNALDIDQNHGYITVDKEYKYLLFNNVHKEYIEDMFNREINIGDNYLKTYKKYEVDKVIKENIDKTFKGVIFEDTITFDNKTIEQKYTPIYGKNDVIAVNILSRDITRDLYLENQLIELSYTDTLTGFRNRRSYNRFLINYNDNDFSVIYVDINGLKFMNDAFGHSEGDKLILLVANEIERKTNKYDSSIYRFGGDEFIILLKNLDYNKTHLLANEIKDNLSKKTLNEIRVSVSIGVSTKIDPNEPIKDIIKRAEKQMYDNKIIYSKRDPFRNIENLMVILKRRDKKLEEHIDNVVRRSLEIGKRLNFDNYNLSLLVSLAKLHDIGKIIIDEKTFINTSLSKEEISQLKTHVDTGYRLLSRVPKYFEIAFDLLCQYENYDGTGYSNGIRGENIPIKSRILRVVTYYDFLTLYLEKGHDEAINFIISEKGKRFDPNIVDLFIDVLKEERK